MEFAVHSANKMGEVEGCVSTHVFMVRGVSSEFSGSVTEDVVCSPYAWVTSTCVIRPVTPAVYIISVSVCVHIEVEHASTHRLLPSLFPHTDQYISVHSVLYSNAVFPVGAVIGNHVQKMLPCQPGLATRLLSLTLTMSATWSPRITTVTGVVASSHRRSPL